MKKKLLMLFLGIFLTAIQVVAQQVTVAGKITSAEDGQPIPGASVKIKGTTTAVQTTSAGMYSIKAKVGDILQFVYLGMTSQERTVGALTTINIVLKEDANSLNEVTITTAYNVERDKKSIGYSLTKVDGDEVSQTGRENFVNGLAGRVPGLSINPTSGDPGASSQIVLRGINSLSGDNQPLMVVDGVPIDNSVVNQMSTTVQGTNRNQDYTNRASDINPADIESYVILKGPEATALYGNLGAGGAIIITTKKAKAGKASVSYNGSLRIETVNNSPEVQQVYSQGDANGVFQGGSTSYFGPKYFSGTKIYDNVGSFFRTGTSQKNNLVFEGGKESFTYRWSTEYTDNKGTIPTTEYKRLVTALTGQAALSPAIKLTTRFSYTNAYNKKANRGLAGYLMNLLLYPARYDINNWIDANGNRVLTTGTIYTEFDNPLWELNKNLADDKTNNILLNTNVTIKPNKWLSMTAIFGANIINTDGNLVYHTQSYTGSGSAATPRGGVINTYNNVVKQFEGSFTATAKHSFGNGNFNNTYILGLNGTDYNNTTNSARGQNMFDPNFYSINNTLPTTQSALLAVYRRRNAGAFLQAIMGYKSLVYLTLSARGDAASRMMPNNPYFAYPSASLAFNFTELSAVKKLDWLSSGKLRASYGETGKEPSKYYALSTRLGTVTTSGGGFKYDLANGGNPELVPEKTIDYEFGTELSFLKNRIGVDFTYYHRESLGQIISPRTSYGSGSVIRIMNGGSVVNYGYEMQLKGSPIRNNNLSWDVTFNFTSNRGIVNSVAEDLPEYYNSDTWIANGARAGTGPGRSTYALVGWVNSKNNNGDLLISPTTGLPILKSSADFVYLGDRAPKFTLGYVNSVRYKNLSLSFLLDLRVGGDVYNQTEYELYRRGLSVKTLDRDQPRIIKGVLADGLENTANPTINNIMITPGLNSNYYNNVLGGIAPEQFLERDINTLRLRDVTIAYDLPASWAAKTKFLSSAGLFVTFTDLFLITNYSGVDPDVNGNTPATGGVGGYGIDYGSMGRPLGVNIGLRIKL